MIKIILLSHYYYKYTLLSTFIKFNNLLVKFLKNKKNNTIKYNK